MRIVIIIFSIISAFGCATTTHYEDCVENDLYKRYGGIQECIAERKEASDRRRNGWTTFGAGFGDALSGAGSSNK